MSLEEKLPVMAYSPEWFVVAHWKRGKDGPWKDLAGVPPEPPWEECVTKLPAIMCTCGTFLLEQFPPGDGILIPR